MTFISYAKNFEDVMLWRALKHVGSGFYVDAGAAWSDEHSVTKAFYERDWCGINIEPNPILHVQLEQQRPKGINVCLAVSDHDVTQAMNLMACTGLSTLNDDIAQEDRRRGWSVDPRQLTVTSLDAIWRQHVPDDQDVHFLKIGVEGSEAAALQGLNLHEFRPWIVVVESTLSLSQVEPHAVWEPVLLNAEYLLAYADEFNRYHVAKAHDELLPVFRDPLNVFDGFKLATELSAETRVQQAQAHAQQMEAGARKEIQRAEATRAERDTVRASWSWCITGPLQFGGVC
ncbi:MAG: FkbM family methyltransferase [Burkholderiales bacterium]|nr:FkbM family methyltransferase [Burkholderiales bacterium]MBK8665214.1 FkbM family methyltransferase [Burkholderiales bacterium]